MKKTKICKKCKYFITDVEFKNVVGNYCFIPQKKLYDFSNPKTPSEIRVDHRDQTLTKDEYGLACFGITRFYDIWGQYCLTGEEPGSPDGCPFKMERDLCE